MEILRWIFNSLSPECQNCRNELLSKCKCKFCKKCVSTEKAKCVVCLSIYHLKCVLKVPGLVVVGDKNLVVCCETPDTLSGLPKNYGLKVDSQNGIKILPTKEGLNIELAVQLDQTDTNQLIKKQESRLKFTGVDSESKVSLVKKSKRKKKGLGKSASQMSYLSGNQSQMSIISEREIFKKPKTKPSLKSMNQKASKMNKPHMTEEESQTFSTLSKRRKNRK
ncbi:uncharacterized protein LOC126266221 [Aethina tumida]|uniref:uncharacterized protein LOC126266221 n=1 Tax=Aethina tumida TaxID=116153 RepID=UPI00214820A5|nr:uncharacterized protein LOC126266221 [Aethina tumida]XP_049825710.1 uncharacterized protein LOC126266221 [Aethina tumida]